MKKIILFLLPVLFQINSSAQNWQLVADTSFGVLGPHIFDMYTLDTGRNYKFVVSGTFTEGGAYWYDVRYSYTPTNSDFGYNFFLGSPAWLVALPPTPYAYNPSHVYEYYFQGDGNPIHFNFTDNGYSDNAGAMYFDLYQECPVANYPVASDTSVCVSQGALLVAGNASNYTWYDSPSGGNVLSTDDSLQIASVLQTDTFYVSTMHYSGCESSRDTVVVIANPLPAVTFNLPLAQDTVCASTAAFTITGESPAGGIFTGAGVSGNMFDPSVAGPGAHMITYSYTDNNGCDNSATQSVYVDVCTGMSEQASNSSVSIIPSPNNGIFRVELPGGFDYGTIQIANMLGEVVYADNNFSSNQDLNLGEIANGMYTIRFVSGDQTIISKFIKE